MNKHNFYLRKVRYSDLELLFKWANDYDVRNNSFSTGQIEFEDHKDWFEKMMKREDIKQYIFVGDEQDIGQVRLTIVGETAEIGYSIAPEFRGRGYGRLMLLELEKKIKDDLPYIKKLIAYVKPNNVVSKKIFMNTGYTEKCLLFELALE